MAGVSTRLQADPLLSDFTTIILDEFHERSLYSDIAVALLREVQQTVRPDLVLLIMSATLEAEPAARYLGGCPIVRAQGRTYPIDVRYAPGRAQADIHEQVASAAEQLLTEPWENTGDVLAFLPGAEEIRKLDQERMLRDDLFAQHPPDNEHRFD